MKVVEVLPNLHTRGKLNTSTTVVQVSRLYRSVVSLTAPGEPALLNWSGYLHCPMSDGATIEFDAVNCAVNRVVDSLMRNRRTLVMCRAGRNRTGLVVCLALTRFKGWSGNEALDWFRKVRPRAVANPTFEAYIRKIPADSSGDFTKL